MRREEIKRIVDYIMNGGLIVYPTDTLYAIGADVYNEIAVREVYRIKKRPFSLPLPVAVPSVDDINKIAYLTDTAKILADRFLPGRITLVLYKKDMPDIVTSGSDKIAIRIPNHSLALKILKKCSPLTVTSANIHGKPVPFTVEEIKRLFGDKLLYVDVGNLNSKPSTIVDCTSDNIKILREGAIPVGDIRKVIEDGTDR